MYKTMFLNVEGLCTMLSMETTTRRYSLLCCPVIHLKCSIQILTGMNNYFQ